MLDDCIDNILRNKERRRKKKNYKCNSEYQLINILKYRYEIIKQVITISACLIGKTNFNSSK